jgi:hypothetical protein
MTRKKPTEKGGSGQKPASGNANRVLTEEGSDIDKRLD